MKRLLLLFVMSVQAYSHAPSAQSRLKALIQQTPWDKRLLKKIVNLDLEHRTALEDKPPNWQKIVQQIENDPDWLPQATSMLAKMALQVPLENKEVNPPVWLATSKDGRKIYLIGTVHKINLENLSLPAKTKFGQIWDKSSVVMWEGFSFHTQRITIELAKKDRGNFKLSNGYELDAQLMAYGLIRSKKKVVSLEEGLWAGHDLGAKTEDRLDREGISKANDPRDELDNNELTDSDKEQYLNEIVDIYELGNLGMISYVAYDMKKKEAIDSMHQELYRTHRTTREVLRSNYLLDARNRFWLQKIKENCQQDEACLLLGGVDHMTFDYQDTVSSILTLLQEDGFQVELLPIPAEEL